MTVPRTVPGRCGRFFLRRLGPHLASAPPSPRGLAPAAAIPVAPKVPTLGWRPLDRIGTHAWRSRSAPAVSDRPPSGSCALSCGSGRAGGLGPPPPRRPRLCAQRLPAAPRDTPPRWSAAPCCPDLRCPAAPPLKSRAPLRPVRAPSPPGEGLRDPGHARAAAPSAPGPPSAGPAEASLE